jgi:hypothetical protein
MKCIGCDVSKSIIEFKAMKRGRKVVLTKCRRCRNKLHAAYLANREARIASSTAANRKDPEKRRLYMNAYMASIRDEIFAKLGCRCVRCGFADRRALQIDHVNGDGYLELRRKLNTFKYLKRVIADKKGRYQILCANCNWINRHEQGEQPNRRG